MLKGRELLNVNCQRGTGGGGWKGTRWGIHLW